MRRLTAFRNQFCAISSCLEYMLAMNPSYYYTKFEFDSCKIHRGASIFVFAEISKQTQKPCCLSPLTFSELASRFSPRAFSQVEQPSPSNLYSNIHHQ